MKVGGIVAFLALACLGPMSADTQTARDVIDRYVQAIGGYEAIDRIQTIQYNRVLTHLDENRVIHTRVYQQRPHRHRIEYEEAGTARIVNGERAWRCAPDPSTGMARWQEMAPGAETDFAQVLGLFLHFEQKGYTVELVGAVSREGRRLRELTLDRPGEATWRLSFDVETGLFTMFEPAPGTVVTVHDFRAFNGVLFPHLTDARGMTPQGGAFHHLNTVTDLELDVPMPDSLFLPPEGESRRCTTGG